MSWLLERLRKYKDDRGMMANLRCILVENKKHRAWPALNRLGVPITDNVSAFIAGLYSTHPEHSTMIGNFGDTCRLLKEKRDDKQSSEKLTPMERRFQHVLASESKDEVKSRVLRMTLLAKTEGVPVNYEQLKMDLRFWPSDRTKTEWAASFWTPGIAPAVEEDV